MIEELVKGQKGLKWPFPYINFSYTYNTFLTNIKQIKGLHNERAPKVTNFSIIFGH